MADADARATAHRHTTHLLKMLRGYGPRAKTEPEPVAASRSAAVAEATPAYVRLLDAAAPPPLPALQVPMADSSPPRGADSIPTVGEILRRPRGKLGQIMAQADQLIQLSRIFHAYLPPYLRDHAVLVRLDPEAWEVRADSAAWATRLRYALPSIGQALGQQLAMTLPKPRIRVVPVAISPQPRRPRLTLTRRNAELLEATACGLTDPRLGAALRRLAAHGRPGSKT
ncbi:MAG: DciA family protein [Candidatus Contendobacter sp.]|nr:DciA family protein [Candidatus Contendobacter sp.]MDS4057972.1 DciA family protein [Candidatus Contendobacter sp.]